MTSISKKIAPLIIICGLLTLSVVQTVRSHCEIPCGIYDDPMRIEMMSEHITTIEKSMNQIIALSAEGEKNYNQIVRWVVNKENHAEYLSEIATQYFMSQRIKPTEKSDTPAYEKYISELTMLHEIVVYSMKTKQTTDLENIVKLRSLVHDFAHSYLGEDAEHDH